MTARERNRFFICLGLSILIGLAMAGTYLLRLNPIYGMLQSQQNLLNDTLIFKGREGQADKVALAHIDEKSVSAFRQQYGRPFSWPRTIHAQVLKNLADAGARVVVYDILFDAPGCPASAGPVCNEDQEFASAIEYARTRRAGGTQVVLAIAGEDSRLEQDKPMAFGEAIPPLGALASKATALGHIHPIPDDDGTVRKMPLVVDIKGEQYPALALQGAALFLRRPKAVDEVQPRTVVFAARPIPVDGNAASIINYQGRPSHLPGMSGPMPALSYVDLYNNKFDPEVVRGKLIFVGLTAIGFADDWYAPTSPLGIKMSGVEVHAQTAQMVLTGAFLTTQDERSTALLMIAISLLTGIVLARFQPFLAAGVTAVLMAGYVIGISIYTGQAQGQLDSAQNFQILNSVYPGTSMLVTFVGVMLYRIVFEQAEQRATKGVMGKYLSPAVMHEVLKDPEGLKLGGEKREMSVLFSDIRGFTSVSEKMDPSALVAFLNEYLTEMTNIVFEHQGVLDKYMGDAIMAFWGAPTKQPDHAVKACLTGYHMMRRLRELQPGWSERGLPPLNIGVGINTGQMTAGNVGSKMRFDYTVMGDAVNLGSRLEGVNKEYGTNIIISEGTYEQVKGAFTARFLDLIAVKGKKEPTAIYELMAPLSDAAAQPPAGFMDRWDAAMESYKAQRFQEAKRGFESVLELVPDDGPAQAFIARCDDMTDTPPVPAGVEWDGVYVMTHK